MQWKSKNTKGTTELSTNNTLSNSRVKQLNFWSFQIEIFGNSDDPPILKF